MFTVEAAGVETLDHTGRHVATRDDERPSLQPSSNTGRQRAPRATLLATGVISAAVMVLQIAITRLLSATASYHSAFAVIALVMLGLAAASTSVFLRQQGPRPADASDAASMLGRAAIVSVMGMLGNAWMAELPLGTELVAAQVLTVGALSFAMFWLSGWALAFVFSAYHQDVSRVYLCDLAGAALGCVVVVRALDATSPMNVIVATGVAFALAGWLLSRSHGRARAGAVFAASITAGALALAFPVLTELRSVKGEDQSNVRWLRWNHLARVTVTGEIPGVRQALEYLRGRTSHEKALAEVLRWEMAGV